MTDTATSQALKTAAKAHLDRIRGRLLDLSHRIHSRPELSFHEEAACAWLCEALAPAFEVEKGACDLPTAFVARAGPGPFHVAILAEYDALPGVGHACGHNIIAASAAGAGILLAPLATELGLRVSVVGTPAEEGGGGKILMLERGAFDGVHAAMMVHPYPYEVIETPTIAVKVLQVDYYGKEAHAAAFPELGINAADALTVAQTAIALLRQQLRPTDRVHGIVTRGGEAANIIPGHTTASYMVRGRTLAEMEDVYERVMRCFEAGALATGARLEVEAEKPYAEVVQDAAIGALYERNLRALGREPLEMTPEIRKNAFSTDMGNISQAIPSIHPGLSVESFPVSNHQPEFAAHAISEAGDRAVLDGALLLAWTAIDVATDEALRKRLVANA